LHELLLATRGYGVVMTQLHRIGALTAGESFQAELIFGDFGQGHKRLDGGAVIGERGIAIDPCPAGRQVTGNVPD
jgi:hypothetical protein